MYRRCRELLHHRTKTETSKGDIIQEHTEVKLMCCSVHHTHVRFDMELQKLLPAKIIRIFCAKNMIIVYNLFKLQNIK